MLPALLTLALSAAPTAAQAGALARGQQWEELYLAFAAASPEASPKAERPKIAAALLQGCRALAADDAVMAFSLGEKSVAFAPSADALHCTGVTARKTDQRAAAEEALGRGLKDFPKDGRFALELGRLHLDEGQADEAAAVLAKVPPKSKESAEAKKLLAELAARVPVVLQPVDAEAVELPGARVAMAPTAEARPTSRSYESSVDEDGRRVRQNQYFRFYYFSPKRDFGQRAEYEGQVQAALEDARVAVEGLLGVAREKPTDVILYSREEFRLHHGPQAAQAVAGFYTQDAIRLNDSAEINPRNRAVLVHEYVHAVMDELLSFNGRAVPTWVHEGLAEYLEWRSEGQDRPPKAFALRLQQLALQHRLPSIAALTKGPLVASGDPGLAYNLSAVAVRLLVERRGLREVVELLRECGRGAPFEPQLERRFGLTVERLDEELTSALK